MSDDADLATAWLRGYVLGKAGGTDESEAVLAEHDRQVAQIAWSDGWRYGFADATEYRPATKNPYRRADG